MISIPAEVRAMDDPWVVVHRAQEDDPYRVWGVGDGPDEAYASAAEYDGTDAETWAAAAESHDSNTVAGPASRHLVEKVLEYRSHERSKAPHPMWVDDLDSDAPDEPHGATEPMWVDSTEVDAAPDIPVRVLRARGLLSPSEAIAVYLCTDPDGPSLSQADAGRAVGVDPRNVHKYLRRADAKRGGE